MKSPAVSQVEKGEHRTPPFPLCTRAYVRFAAVVPPLLDCSLGGCFRNKKRGRSGDELLLAG